MGKELDDNDKYGKQLPARIGPKAHQKFNIACNKVEGEGLKQNITVTKGMFLTALITKYVHLITLDDIK